MPLLVKMPSLSPTMEQGSISSWKKKEGDWVEAGELLAEIETDKALMDFEATDEGYVRKILVEEGSEVEVGAPIIVLAESAEEDIQSLLEQGSNQESEEQKATPQPTPEASVSPAKPKEAPTPQTSVTKTAAPALQAATLQAATAQPKDQRLRVSPYARKLAEEKGVLLQNLKGTGPAGRIIAKDVEEAPKATSQSVSSMLEPEFEDLPLTNLRKAIAKNMVFSKQSIPHFQTNRKVRAEKLIQARQSLVESFPEKGKPSLNDFVIKALGMALKEFPKINSWYMDTHLRQFRSVDVAVAVGTEEGLFTPIVRQVEKKGLWEISQEMRALAQKARERKLSPQEYTGGSFTLSNLGMFGIDEFNGIINPPQVCILAVSAVKDEPVVENNTLVAGKTMNITLSSDHRAIDGVLAAQFLAYLTRILECPWALLGG